MVNLKREGFDLLRNIFKLGREIIESDEETTTEIPLPFKAENFETEPMTVYWESAKEELSKNNESYSDVFLKKLGLDRIPDTTEKPIAESHYDYERLSLVYMPELIQRIDASSSTPHSLGIIPSADVTEGAPKPGAGIPSGRDAGVVAGIVAAVISGVIILGTLIAVFMYRHYVHRNVTSMNFDNPVYRKTTEDQFALEKNGYAPGSKLYPSTVGEEGQEPLNPQSTNDFV